MWTCGDRPNQRHAMTMMKIVSCLDSVELWQPDSINEGSLTCITTDQHLCKATTVHRQLTHTDVLAMASASWLAALSPSKPLLASNLPHSQLCTSSDELSQFHLSRDCVTAIRPHWASPSSRLAALSRSQSKTAGGRSAASDYCAQFSSFSSGAQLVHSVAVSTRFHHQLLRLNSWALRSCLQSSDWNRTSSHRYL